MRLARQLLLLAALLALGAGLWMPANSEAYSSCSPPRGPGDNLVHSSNLRASGVDCATARRVVLASTKGSGHFSEGVPFDVGGYKWRCYASPYPNSHQRCTAYPGKVVSIIWGD
jgi:hypothetical protein